MTEGKRSEMRAAPLAAERNAGLDVLSAAARLATDRRDLAASMAVLREHGPDPAARASIRTQSNLRIQPAGCLPQSTVLPSPAGIASTSRRYAAAPPDATPPNVSREQSGEVERYRRSLAVVTSERIELQKENVQLRRALRFSKPSLELVVRSHGPHVRIVHVWGATQDARAISSRSLR